MKALIAITLTTLLSLGVGGYFWFVSSKKKKLHNWYLVEIVGGEYGTLMRGLRCLRCDTYVRWDDPKGGYNLRPTIVEGPLKSAPCSRTPVE